MCNQVPSVTLQTAILMQIQEFVKNNIPFSIHDITRNLRDKTTKGEIEIPEVEVNGNSFHFNISHTKVKSHFEELWRTGVFDPDFYLNRQFNGMYFVYTATPVNISYNVDGISVTPQVQCSTGVPTTATTPNGSGNSTLIGPDEQFIWSKVERYLIGCKSRDVNPTLKQVQSAIKRRHSRCSLYSCEELKHLIEKQNYIITNHPNGNSKSKVICCQ